MKLKWWAALLLLVGFTWNAYFEAVLSVGMEPVHRHLGEMVAVLAPGGYRLLWFGVTGALVTLVAWRVERALLDRRASLPVR